MKHIITKIFTVAAFFVITAAPMFGQSVVTIWSENFNGLSADATPTAPTNSSYTGVTYTCTNGAGASAGATKVMNDKLAGGSSTPELMVGKKGSGTGAAGGKFTVVVPLDNFEGTLTLTYYQNKQSLKVSSTTSGISGGQTLKPSEAGQQTTTFTGITTSTTSITIVFEATTTNNVRLDDIVLTGTKASETPSAAATTTTIDATGITNTDVYTSTAAGSLSASVTSGGNAVAGATVTWSGNNDAVATINASTGAVTLVSAGSVTFTASYAGVADQYQASSATYQMTVTDSTPSTTTTILASGITNTDVYTSTAAGTLSASVTSGGSPVAGATVTWSGNNDAVAMIDATGAVTLVSAGSVTFTATYAGVAHQYQASSANYEMTVTSSAPYVQPTRIEITPNYTFWGQTAQFSGSTYSALFGSKDNLSLAWSRGSGSTYANQSAMRFYKDNILTFTAPSNFEIKSIVFEITGNFDDLTFSPAGFNSDTKTWSGSSATVSMSRPSDASSYATISKITITIGEAAPVTPTCATPTFSPSAGLYTSAQNVTISTETSGATIYYTTDGTDPTTSSNVYSSAISVSSTTTIKAMAVKADYDNSEIASSTYTIINLDHAGTEADPYSVADARTAIDNNYSLTGKYATGIVSAIPTAWSTQYNNITFNFVDESGDADFLQAYRCASGDADASEIQVGDIVIVTGNLTKYNSTYEFAQGCTLVSLTHPVVTVEAPTFSPVAGTYASAQTVTIASETSGASIYYTTDGTVPTSASTLYEEAINVSSVTTIKAIAVLGSDYSTVSTATYHICSENSPYTVAQALAFNEYPANGVYVSGIVSTAPSQAPTSNGELTYYISVDGEAQNQLEVYKGKGLNQAVFTAQDDIKVGDIVTIYGNVVVFNDIIEFASGNYLVAFEHPVNPSITVTPATVNPAATVTEGTLSLSYENLTIAVENDFAVQFCNSEGVALSEGNAPDWITALVESQGNGYVVSYVMDENNGQEARTAYLKVFAMGSEDFVYSNLVTITQAAPVVDYAELPFSFDGGRADMANTTGLTQVGLDSDYGSSPKLKFNSADDYVILKINERPGILTFDVKGNPGGNPSVFAGTFKVQTSEDGSIYTDLASYDDLPTTIQSKSFNNLGENVRYIKWIYASKTSGNVALGNISLAAYVAPEPQITLSSYSINAAAVKTEGTLEVTYTEIETSLGASIYWYTDATGTTTTTEPDWIEADINETSMNVDYLIEENTGEARTAYFKVYGVDGEANGIYSNIVTISQAAYVAPPSGDQYALYSGSLVEGDYIIFYNGKAMNNTVDGDRLQYEEVTPANDVITTGDATIVWHIAPSGDYWTIYSADADAYAAGTGAKNKAQMIADGTDDKALWTVTGDGPYEFVNKANAANSVNANLRENGTYGFACYATGTGGALSLYKLVVPETINLIASENAGRYWTTFYSSKARYTLSNGAQAFTMNANHELYRLGTNGGVIPANTAVVIISKTAAVTLTKSDSTSSVDVNGGGNILHGSDKSIAKPATGKTYVLGIVGGAIGFYEYTSADIPAAKAYYTETE